MARKNHSFPNFKLEVEARFFGLFHRHSLLEEGYRSTVLRDLWRERVCVTDAARALRVEEGGEW
jgi:hypothetical protein